MAEPRYRSMKKGTAMIKAMIKDYDLILVDLPSENERRDRYDIYLPLLQSLDHVTLSISLRESRFSEIQEMKDYFASYKIPVKGTVIDRRLEGVG
jgi:Mrp family chromosome partitioning ATPase